MTDEKAPESTAVWFFVAATFLFAAAAFVMTRADGSTLIAAVALVTGAVVCGAGIFMLRREAQQRRR